MYRLINLRYYVRGTRAAPMGAAPATVHDLVWSGLGQYGDRTAISCPESGRKQTYSNLRKLSSNLAYWINHNTPKGTQFCTLLPNSIEMAISALGTFEAGATLSPLNPDYTVEEISGVLKRLNPKWIVTTSAKVHDVLEAAKIAGKGTNDIGIVTIDDDIMFSGVKSFDELLGQSGSFQRYEDEPALLLCSPRDVTKISQSNIVANCVQVSSPELNYLEVGDKLGAHLPMFTSYGLTHTLLKGLASGAEVVTISNARSKYMINALKTNKVRVLPTVSPMAELLASYGKEALSGLRTITIGGKPNEGCEKLKRVFSGELLHNYGPAEGPVLFQQRRGVEKNGSVGEPLPGTEARVLAPGGADLPDNAEGEIWVRGPQIGDGAQWVRTGDKGYSDSDGWFYVTGQGEMSVDGLRIIPEEMEAAINTLNSVRESAIFQVDQNLVAAVIPDDPYRPPSLRDIVCHLENKLAPYKRISDVVIVSSLPKNSAGDIVRCSLGKNYNPRLEFVAMGTV